MANKRNGSDNIKKMCESGVKKFVRYEEGAQLFSVGVHTFADLAKAAGAVYKVHKVVLVNVQKVEEFLEKECRESR